MKRREWFSAAELAELGLPDVPSVKANVILMAERLDWRRAEWTGTRWRPRIGRGGGTEYHVSVLPRTAQIKLAFDGAQVNEPALEGERTGMWRWFEGLPQHKRDEARRRLEVLDAVGTLVRAGVSKTFAAMEIAREAGVAVSGLYRWEALIHGVERADRLPYLAPRHAGRPSQAECSPEAW